MKCVICKGDAIVLRTVDEQIALENDIVLIRLKLPVCSQCGERYYDRRAMTHIEDIRAMGRKRALVVDEVGKVLRPKVMPIEAWAA